MAHTFTNLSFETEGATIGTAAGWAKSVLSSLTEVVDFGVAAPTPYEEFAEGWLVDDFISEFAVPSIDPASWPSGLSTPLFAESFEWGYLSNEFWAQDLTEVPTGDAVFTGGLDAEAFEVGWDNTGWTATLGVTEDALHDGGVEDHESFNFEFVSNGNALWEGLEETYETSVDPGVGSSPSNWPLGVEFSNGPTRLILPAGVYDFEAIYVEVGDTLWVRNSDVGDSNGARVVTSVDGGTIGVEGVWDNTGTASTRVFLSTINNAAFVNHGGGGTPNFAPEHEYFNASAWEEMDTL